MNLVKLAGVNTPELKTSSKHFLCVSNLIYLPSFLTGKALTFLFWSELQSIDNLTNKPEGTAIWQVRCCWEHKRHMLQNFFSNFHLIIALSHTNYKSIFFFSSVISIYRNLLITNNFIYSQKILPTWEVGIGNLFIYFHGPFEMMKYTYGWMVHQKL